MSSTESTPARGEMRRLKTLHIYDNPSAGLRGRRNLELFLDELQRRGFTYDLHVIEAATFGKEVQSRAKKGGLVIISGGDGTLSAAADALHASDAILVPVPTGTLNHFARRYGINSVHDAVEALSAGLTRSVTVGLVNGEAFINNVSFGIYPLVVRKREQYRRWLSKWPAAAIGAIAALIQLPQLDMTVEVQGRRIVRTTPLLWVGLGKGSFTLGEVSQPYEHVLEVVIATADSRLGMLALAMRTIVALLQRRRVATVSGLEVLHTQSVVLKSDKRIDVGRDGEVRRMNPPLTITLRPHALRIRVPDSNSEPSVAQNQS